MTRPHPVLSITARQILRLLTAAPAAPEHVDIELVCDIGEVSRGVALHLLHELDVAGFADQIDLGQWRLHADPDDAPDPIFAARMIVWTIECATQADATIRPYSRREAPCAARLRPTTFASPDEAMKWFEAARPRLLTLLHALVDTARYTCAWQLGEALWGLSRCAGWHEDALTAQQLTAEALEREFLSRIALVRARASDVLLDIHDATAAEEATAAVDLARRAGDPRALSTALAVRGRASHQAGKLVAALDDAENALTLATHAGLDKVDDTLDHLDQAEALLTDLDDQLGRARVLTARSDVLIRMGEHAQACDALTEALLVVENSANARYIAEVLNLFGRASEAQGRRDAARDYYTRAFAHYSTANHSQRAEEVQEQLDQLDTDIRPASTSKGGES